MASLKPFHIRNGIKNDNAHAADILPKFRCQIVGAKSGTMAMEIKIPAKGIILNSGRSSPSLPDEADNTENIAARINIILTLIIILLNYFIQLIFSHKIT